MVTAISPTPAEGKTTTSVGLVDGLCPHWKKAMICLRSRVSIPCFGMKDGGYEVVISPFHKQIQTSLKLSGTIFVIGVTHNLYQPLVITIFIGK